MIRVRAMAAPSASCAPCAMATAALPTAATPPGSAAADAGGAARAHASPPVDALQPGLQQRQEQLAAWIAGVRSLAPAHHFQLAAALTAGKLGGIRAFELQPLEILRGDVPGNVEPRETRGVEFLDARILVLAGGNQVLEVLVDEPVRADQARHLLYRAAARDQLAHRRHVDAVDVGEAHRWCRGSDVHLGRARLACQLDDLRRGGAAHDRIVHQQHRLAAELQVDGVELAAHRLLALLLAGHDEGAADVAILDEALAVLNAEALRQLQGTGAAGVRDGDDDVDVVDRALAQDLVRQAVTHAHAGAVHRDVVDLGIGAREIHVLEDARRVPRGGDALLGVQPALFVDEHRLPGRHVAHQAERQAVERHALGGEHPLGAARRAPLAEHQRADAVRVAKAEHSVADDHGDHRVAAAAAAVERRQRREHVRRRDARRADALQLGGEHVQQHLRIGGGVQVAPVFADQDLGELHGIGEVAVVAEADAVGRIDVEGLRLGGTVAAGGRVTHVADADVALELEHVMLLEHVAHQAAALAHAQLPLARGGSDAGGVLAAVLQYRERVVEPLVHGAGPDDAGDAAHSCVSSSYLLARTYPRLAHQHPQPVGDRLAVGNQYGLPPPALPLQLQQLREDHEHSEQHHAAQQPEQETEQTVDAAEQREAYEVRERCADGGAEQQHQHHDDDARRPRPDFGLRQQPAEVRRDQGREMPGEEQRDDPGGEPHRFAQEAARRTDDGGNQDGGNHHVVGRVHPKLVVSAVVVRGADCTRAPPALPEEPVTGTAAPRAARSRRCGRSRAGAVRAARPRGDPPPDRRAPGTAAARRCPATRSP